MGQYDSYLLIKLSNHFIFGDGNRNDLTSSIVTLSLIIYSYIRKKPREREVQIHERLDGKN